MSVCILCVIACCNCVCYVPIGTLGFVIMCSCSGLLNQNVFTGLVSVKLNYILSKTFKKCTDDFEIVRGLKIVETIVTSLIICDPMTDDKYALCNLDNHMVSMVTCYIHL